MADFSHITEDGNVCMVDIAAKGSTVRVATATSTVYCNEHTFSLLMESALPKGDVLTTAKIAGILAAKNTASLIPMCHPLLLSSVDIAFQCEKAISAIRIYATVKTQAQTGVEMEALVAVQVAALTIYDMCKAVQKDIRIEECYLLSKTGGKSGDYFHKNATGCITLSDSGGIQKHRTKKYYTATDANTAPETRTSCHNTVQHPSFDQPAPSHIEKE